MMEGARLHAKQINHGQCEIWLGKDDKELTARRKLATNEVVNVARRHCTPEAFGDFYRAFCMLLDQIAVLDVSNLEAIATELKLKA